MSDSLRVPAALWDQLRREFPELEEAALVRLALERGRALEATRSLRAEVATRTAAAILLLERVAALRARRAQAERDDRATYERDLELRRDVVPPLEERAKALRARIRALEGRLRGSGVDPSTVEPSVDWSDTLAVDDHEPPRFESDEDRRRAALEFFGRHG